MPDQDSDIACMIVRLLDARAHEASICPSDVARTLHSDEDEWRALMPRIREVASQMAIDGRLVISQGETLLDPTAPFKGAMRLRRGERFAAK